MALIEVVLCDYSYVLNKNIFNTGEVSWKQCHQSINQSINQSIYLTWSERLAKS